MKKMLFAILTLTAISIAAEQCNDGTSNGEIPLNSCYNDGYICKLATESSGIVRFYLGTTSNCQTFETTRFVTHPYNTNGTLNESITDNFLRPLIVEDPMDNVNALADAVNTAFILNAFNERLKVRVTYHRLGNVYDVNSVRLQGIAKIP